MDELTSAVRNGDVERVQELISDTDLTIFSAETKCTLLCDAVTNEHVEIVKLLLQKGFSANTPAPPTDEECSISDSPLHVAVKSCNPEIVQILLDAGASVNQRNLSNDTPLYEAVASNHIEIIKLLLDHNADVNSQLDGCTTVLDRAAYGQQDECVKLLIDRGAVFSKNIRRLFNNQIQIEQTLLHVAIDRSYSLAVRHLLRRGTNVNATCSCMFGADYTPLHFACIRSNPIYVSLLLSYGADVKAKTRDNVTSLHLAVTNVEIVKILLENGADVNAEDDRRRTVLYMAAKNADRACVNTILNYNPDVNKKGNVRALTAVIISLSAGKRQNVRKRNEDLIVQSLLLYGFTIKPESLDDYRVLHDAIEVGYPVVAEEFLKLCTDFSSILRYTLLENHYTLLHTACKWNNTGIVERLLDKGADINVKTVSGVTPIEVAVSYNAPDVVQLLLTRGVDVNIRNKQGDSLLYIATKKGHPDVVDALLKHKPDKNDSSNKMCLRTAVIDHLEARLVESLLGYGFRVEQSDENNYTFLLQAARKGYITIVKDILKFTTMDGIMSLIGEEKYTPLHAAAEGRQREMVELLINYGFDVNSATPSKFTPLFFIIKSMMLHTAYEDHERNKLTDVRSNCMKIVEILLQKGAKVRLGKTTALHLAASECRGMQETAKLLLNHGASLHCRDKSRQTPLFEPVRRGDEELVKFFIQRGALNALDFKKESDRNLLHQAAVRGYHQIFEICLKLGIDINPTDGKGRSTLDFACEKPAQELIKYLLEYGCELDIEKYRTGHAARILKEYILKLDIAELNKYYTIANEYDEAYVELADKYLNEMERIEEETIGDSDILFCDLFGKDTFQLASYAKNKSVVQTLLSQDCGRDFPQYAGVMRGLIWRGIARNCLQEHGLEIFRYYCEQLPYLPDHCVDHIFRFLVDEELRCFVRGHLDMFSFAQEVIQEVDWPSEKKTDTD